MEPDLAVDAAGDAAAAVEALAACTRPFLIGVRHHSPLLAAAVPALLLVELPPELEPWIGWLGDPATVAPIALAVAGRNGNWLGFYPFAAFSPELAAIRWAVSRGGPVRAIDLPATATARLDTAAAARGAANRTVSGAVNGRITAALLRRFGVPDREELWDRLVEVPSCGCEPERIRRAALALGWATRADTAHGSGIPRRDLAREAWMRRRIASAAADPGASTEPEADLPRLAAVVGAFHTAALLDEPELAEGASADPDPAVAAPAEPAMTALVPYAFSLLDSRSGYPAGIRDPAWQQAVWEAGGVPEAVERAAATLAVRVCVELRDDRQVAGVPDACEAFRLAGDVARLRGLPAPGRRELLEGIQTALGQGEPLGRGRALAHAMGAALVGAVAAGHRGNAGAGCARRLHPAAGRRGQPAPPAGRTGGRGGADATRGPRAGGADRRWARPRPARCAGAAFGPGALPPATRPEPRHAAGRRHRRGGRAGRLRRPGRRRRAGRAGPPGRAAARRAGRDRREPPRPDAGPAGRHRQPHGAGRCRGRPGPARPRRPGRLRRPPGLMGGPARPQRPPPRPRPPPAGHAAAGRAAAGGQRRPARPPRQPGRAGTGRGVP